MVDKAMKLWHEMSVGKKMEMIRKLSGKSGKFAEKSLAKIKQLYSRCFQNVFKKDFVVGLDIGTHSVKLAQFAKKEEGFRLIKAGLEEIAPAEDAISRQKEIISSLKKLLGEIDIKKSKFIVSINCPKTCARTVSVPHMPKGELASGIRMEAKNYFPFPVEEALLDFEILGSIVEKGVKRHRVLVATSPEKTIDEYLSLLDKVGIKPTSFIPLPSALQKLIEVTGFEKDEIEATLDIGGCFTELTIFAGNFFIFSRKIPVAGDDFTKAMSAVLVSDRGKTELSLDEAEKIKRKVGIPRQSEEKMINDKISTSQILSMLRSPLERLVDEIDRCFDYYREETGGGKVNMLVLLGGGAFLNGLPEFLSEELEVKVKVGVSPESIKIDSGAIAEEEKIFQRLTLAVGAALSEGRGINLLPLEIKEEAKRTFKRATVESAAVSLVLILAFIYVGMGIKLGNSQKRISAARIELLSLQPQFKQAEAQNLAAKILATEPYWEDVFKELSNLIPADIYFTEFAMEKRAIKIRGAIVSGYPEESLSKFILALERGIFKNVKLVTTKKMKEKTANEFELKCWID